MLEGLENNEFLDVGTEHDNYLFGTTFESVRSGCWRGWRTTSSWTWAPSTTTTSSAPPSSPSGADAGGAGEQRVPGRGHRARQLPLRHHLRVRQERMLEGLENNEFLDVGTEHDNYLF